MTRTEAIDILKCLAWHKRPSEEEIEEAIKMAINSLKVDEMYQLKKEDTDEFVNLKTFKQVMRERDIAISQLEELGYDFGEEIRQEDEFIPKSVIEDIRREIEQIEINGFVDEKTMFTRTGTQVKTIVLDIIDKHISGKEQ